MRLRVILFTLIATVCVSVLAWAVEPYNSSGRWACMSGNCVIGHAQADSIQLLTDGTGDAEIALPAGSIGAAEMTYSHRGSFNICGDATTVNANTVYYGPNLTLLANTSGGQTCDINAAGNTTEATVDLLVYADKAFAVTGMTCRGEGDMAMDLSYTLRSAAAATVPSVTCTIPDNYVDCVADVQTTTDIAAGATVAIAVAGAGSVGANGGFVCEVEVAF